MRRVSINDIYNPIEVEVGDAVIILHPVLYLERDDITRAGFDGQGIEEGQVHDIADAMNNSFWATGDFERYVSVVCADLLEDIDDEDTPTGQTSYTDILR